jgi:hypothetical protein
MAQTTKSNTRNRARTGSRLGPIGDSIRERPLATAAVATAAAAAGAFFFARRSGVTTDTVAKWGQDAKEEFGNLTGLGKADSDNAGQSSASGTGATAKSATPSSKAASKLSSSTSGENLGSGESGGKPAAGKLNEASSSDRGGQTSQAGGNTGLDATSKDQSEVGSVAYGA